MAIAQSERRYTLRMNESEAQTLFAILGNVFIDDTTLPTVHSRYEQDITNLVHLHEVLAKAGGLSGEYALPVVGSD